MRACYSLKIYLHNKKVLFFSFSDISATTARLKLNQNFCLRKVTIERPKYLWVAIFLIAGRNIGGVSCFSSENKWFAGEPLCLLAPPANSQARPISQCILTATHKNSDFTCLHVCAKSSHAVYQICSEGNGEIWSSDHGSVVRQVIT